VPPRQPYYFHRSGGQPLVFTGLWDVWHDAEGRAMRSCTIITTAANGTVAPVHNRMPVVLAPGSWDEWLAPGPLPSSGLAQLLAPAPDDLLDAYSVGSAVNDVRKNSAELVAPRLDGIRGTG